MQSILPIHRWLETALAATNEVAQASLACEGIHLKGHDPATPEHPVGAYIPLIAGDDALHLGILASAEGCRSLSNALLGTEEGGEELPEGDVVDAVAEIANMIAGCMQRKLADEIPVVELGIPIFIRGEVVTEHFETASASVGIGDVCASVLVVRKGRKS